MRRISRNASVGRPSAGKSPGRRNSGLFDAAARERLQSEGGTAKDAAVNVLRDRILDLSLPAGLRIDDRVLIDKLGLGRTPAREALHRLAAEGLIVIQKNKGAFVRSLDLRSVREFFDAYFAAERLVGFFCRAGHPRLVADLEEIEDRYDAVISKPVVMKPDFLELSRINSEFHGRLAGASDNEFIVEFSARLHNHARRISYFIFLADWESSKRFRRHQKKVTGDHRDIILAVRHGRNDKVVSLLTRHAALFHSRVMQAIDETKGQFSPLPAAIRGDRVASETMVRAAPR